MVKRRRRKSLCHKVCKVNWGKFPRAFSLRKASSTLPTTDTRLAFLNRLSSVLWVAFATGITMAQRQSSGGLPKNLIFKGFGKDPANAGSLIRVEGFQGPLGF